MTKEQKWLNTITEFALNSDWLMRHFGGYCEDVYSIHRHHVVGRKAKEKVNLVSTPVGHWYVLPLPVELHDVHSNNKYHVAKCRPAFNNTFGTELELFRDLIDSMLDSGYTIPFDLEIMGAL